MKICKEDNCQVAIPSRKQLCEECRQEKKRTKTVITNARQRSLNRYIEKKERSFGQTNPTEYYTPKRIKEIDEDGSYLPRDTCFSV